MALVAPTSTREGYTSTSEQVQVVATSTHEGYSSVGELIGYDSVFHDRDGYTSVSESVGVGATSTREGYAGVAELIGYDSVFHDRTAYVSVSESVGIPLPVYAEVRQRKNGWGVPILPPIKVRVYSGGDAGVISVSQNTQMGPPAAGSQDGFTTVFEGDVTT